MLLKIQLDSKDIAPPSRISFFLLRGGQRKRKIKRQGCPSLSRLLDVMIPRCRTVVHVLIEEDYDLQQLYEINDK